MGNAYMQDYTEKRNYIRIQTESSITYRELGSTTTHQGKCINLSAGGVLFTSEYRVNPGTLMEITITPALNMVKPLDATIQVVRSQTRHNGDYAIAGEIKALTN